MVNFSHEAYCCLPHWGLRKWPNEGENTKADSTDQSPLVHRPREETRQYLRMMKTTFYVQWCSEQRVKKDDIWRPQLWNASKRETACFRLSPRDAQTNCMQLNHIWFGTHWEHRERLVLFTHHLPCRQNRPPPQKPQKHNPDKFFHIWCPHEKQALTVKLTRCHRNVYCNRATLTGAISGCFCWEWYIIMFFTDV